MKPKSNISTYRYSRVAISSTLKAMFLVLILLKTESNVEGSSGAAGAVTGVAEPIVGVINGVAGQLEINGDISKYTRSITTNYKGVKIEQTWEAEENRRSGIWRYLYTCESAQFTEQTLFTSTKAFEISENGSRYGDVPLEVRNFSCSYNFPQEDGSRQVYSWDNQTEFQVRVNSKYTTTPWLGVNKVYVSVFLYNWTPEQINCDPIMGFPYKYANFGNWVAVNGFGYITVRSYKQDGKWINLSSGDGAGFGFTK